MYQRTIVSRKDVMVVVTAGFLNAAVAFLNSMNSIFLLQTMREFNLSLSSASWAFSINFALNNLCGCLIGVLIRKYGNSVIVIVTGLFLVGGTMFASFVQSNIMLCAAYGVIGGIGCSGLNVCSVTIVQQHFQDNRAFALGICCWIGSLGNLVGAPGFVFLSSVFGWRGTLLLLSGVLLNAVPCGLFLIAISRKGGKGDSSVELTSYRTYNCNDREKPIGGIQENTSLLQCGSGTFTYNSSYDCSMDASLGRCFNDKKMAIGDKEVQQNNGIYGNDRDEVTNDVKVNSLPSQTAEEKLTIQLQQINTTLQNGMRRSKNDLEETSMPIVDSRLPDGSTETSYRESLNHNGLNISSPDTSEQELHEVEKTAERKYGGFMSWDILLDPAFALFTVSRVGNTCGWALMYAETPARAVSNGISEYHSSLIVSTITITNSVTRFLSSIIINLRHVNRTLYYTVACFLATGAMLLSCFFTDLTGSFLTAGFAGIWLGCLRTAVRVVMVDIVGADHSHIAEGWSLTYTGIIYLGLFPLAGWVNDVTGDYNMAFYIGGGFMFVGGLTAMLIYIFYRKRTVNKNI